MKKRKGSLLQRMMAVLLSAVLVAGMVSNAAPASVLAEENAGSPEEGEDRGGREEAGVIEEETGSGGGKHDSENGGSESDGNQAEGSESESGGGETEQDSGAVQEQTELETEEETQESVSENTAADEENENLQALFKRIAALPDVTEYSGLEPEDGDVYEEWRAGLYAHAQEALAIQEAVEALSEEEQAKIPEDAIAKLAAWAEIAEHTAESSTVMTADTHEHNGVTFTPWTETDRLPTTAGNYYLTEDVTLNVGVSWSPAWSPADGTKLCLNGHTVKPVSQRDVIGVNQSITFSMYDCRGNGMITQAGDTEESAQYGCGICNNGTVHMYGGRISGNARKMGAGVYNGETGTFYLHDGEISNNKASYSHGGAYNNGVFYMYDGRITGNQARFGGGLNNYSSNAKMYLYGGEIIGNHATSLYGGLQYSDGTMKMGGALVLKDNTAGSNHSTSNLCLWSKIIELDSERPLESGAYVGITTAEKPTLSSNINITGHNKGDYSSYFHSDNPAYVIVNQADVVQLALPEYDVTVNGGTVSGGTGSASFKAGATVTITANTPESGKAFDKWVVNSGGVTLANAANATTTFTMPAEAVEVTATYKGMHTHKICAGSSCADGSHEDVEWIPLTFTDGKMYAGEKEIEKTRSGYELKDGNYYLADNIRIDDGLSQICIDQADVHLCLNGKTLSFGESAVWIYGGKLTLCDCAGNGAINAAKQAAVSIADIEPGKRAFIMYGGSLKGSGCDFVAGAYSKESEAKFFGGNVADMKVKLSREEKFDPVTNSFGPPVLKTPVFIGQPVKPGTKIKVDFNWSKEYDGELSDVPVVKAAEGYTFTEADLANLDIEVIAGDYTDTEFQKKIQNVTIVLCQHKHVLTKHEAVPATCEKQGTGEYWKCEGTDGCGKMFSDAGGQTEITPDSVKIAALGHDYNTSEWGYQGADGHAHKCSNCDVHDAVQEHTPGAAATETTPQTCTVCGYEIAPATGGGGSSGGNENNGGNGSGNNNGGGNNSGNNNGNSQTAYNPDTAPVRVKSENQGNIVKEVTIKAEDTFDASFDAVIAETVLELADIVLTQEEKELADDGANIKIVLDIQDAQNTVSAADKAVVESALSTDVMQGFTVGQYLDVNLFKIINDNRSAIRETNKKIIVTIAVPDRLKNTDANSARVFAVVRVHNGAAEVLTDLDNSDDTITIATDRFSSYAIVYNDTVDSGVTLGDNSIPNSQKDNEPKTGDITPLELYATLAMIAGFAYLLLYFADRERGMTEERKKELVARLVGWAKQGGRIRKYLALAAIFVLLVYYHSIGKKTSAEWKVIYGE